jgi:hypothetical protein
MFHGNCPRCSSEIPQESVTTGQAMCSACGWTDPSFVISSQSKNEKKTITALVVAAIVIVLGYAHLVSWGSYAVKAPFMKIGEMAGMLSTPSLRELGQVCIDLNKWSCAKKAYLGIYTKNGDVSGLADLAYLQSRLNENEAAVATYTSYLKGGGKNGEAILRYAKLLEITSHDVDAMKMYEDSIVVRPDILPVQATAGIVRVMMKQGHFQEARERILAFHASAGNAKGFLNTELTQLDNYFKSKGKSVKAAPTKRAATPQQSAPANGDEAV